MTGSQLLALTPLIALATAVVTLMLVIGFYRNHRLSAMLALAGLVATLACLPLAASVAPLRVTLLLVVDGHALFYTALVVGAALVSTAQSLSYFGARRGFREEWYLLMLIAVLGAVVLAGSRHFASFFIGLEIVSVSLFAMVGYTANLGEGPSTTGDRRSLEAAVKYLILSGVASPLLLFGIALIYAQSGTLSLNAIAEAGSGPERWLVLGGNALLFAGIGFKLSLVPFHLWTPDVYEGAPAPTTGFLATVSKVAVFAFLLRYAVAADIHRQPLLIEVLSALALASMLAGNLLALLQDNVKRILAYSSIAHMGYLLVALIAGGALAAEAVGVYLVGYTVMTLGAFGVIAILSIGRGGQGDVDALSDYAGLFWRRPWLAGAFVAMLLALAGIPLTAGFIAKFYALAAGVQGRLWWLVAALIAGSAIGLVYYLRIVITLFRFPDGRESPPPVAPARAGAVALAVTVLLLLWFGLLPEVLIEQVRAGVIAGADQLPGLSGPESAAAPQ